MPFPAFKNKKLKLTTGEYIGVCPNHVNKTGSVFGYLWHDTCVTTDENRAVTCCYHDNNFVETQKSNCTEAGLALDLAFWKYEEENWVNFVKHHKNGCRDYGGGRSIDIDETSGKMFMKPLVLGKRADGSVELVPKNDSRALRVKSVPNPNQPQYLELQDGSFIGRKYDSKKWAGEWRYIELCVTNDQSKAFSVTFDSQFIITDYQGEMCFDLAKWEYKKGNILVCVNSTTPGRAKLQGGGRDFVFYPDGQIGMKQKALGKKKDGSNRLVLVKPDSPNAVKLDLDYLTGESFLEAKNIRIEELERIHANLIQEVEALDRENKKFAEEKRKREVDPKLIEELKAEHEKLMQENKELKDQLSCKKQAEELTADNMKLQHMIEKLNFKSINY